MDRYDPYTDSFAEKGETMRFREKNKKMALYSAIEAKKIAYQNYKAMLVAWIQSTWIGDDGNYVTLKSNYAEKLQEAKEEFIRASSKVEHYKKEVEDDEGRSN